MTTRVCSGADMIRFAKAWEILGWGIQRQVEEACANKFSNCNVRAIEKALSILQPYNDEIARALQAWLNQERMEREECE
jgi:hypothetical protein